MLLFFYICNNAEETPSGIVNKDNNIQRKPVFQHGTPN